MENIDFETNINFFANKHKFKIEDVTRCLIFMSKNNYSADKAYKATRTMIDLCPDKNEDCKKVTLSIMDKSFDFTYETKILMKRLLPIFKELKRLGV